MRSILAVLLLTGLCSLGYSDTLAVPSQYATIQSAIDASMSGDTVLVSPGTYLENLNFNGKDITLISTHGAADTVIDGNQSGSVVRFENNETLSARLEGFTITNGDEDSGSGIYCNNASPTIHSNRIEYNGSSNSNLFLSGGAGIHLFSSGAHIENNDILHNASVANSVGGGIDCHLSTVSIINNRISYNTVPTHSTGWGFGGGIYCSDSTVVIEDNDISFNVAENDGGGIYLDDCSGAIDDNSINDNTAERSGGGIYCSWCNGDSEVDISNNTISDNTVLGGIDFIAEGGGGLYMYRSAGYVFNNLIHGNDCNDKIGGAICCYYMSYPQIRNNLIYDNRAQNGGGIACYKWAGPDLMNNTLIANQANAVDGVGGGIFCLDTCHPECINTICWNNSAFAANEICIADISNDPSSLTISYSTVKGGESGAFVEIGCALHWGSNMLEENPLFVDPGTDDYHLTWVSPCINRGINEDAPADDLDGDARPYMGSVDMGYDEFVGLHPLESDLFALSVTGGTVNFNLDGGLSNSGRYYVILASMSGSVPGVSLPGGGKTLPINWDGTTDFVLGRLNSPICNHFLAPLNGFGQGSGSLNVTSNNPNQLGNIITFAYCLEGNPDWDFVSNPVQVEWVP